MFRDPFAYELVIASALHKRNVIVAVDLVGRKSQVTNSTKRKECKGTHSTKNEVIHAELVDFLLLASHIIVIRSNNVASKTTHQTRPISWTGSSSL